MIQKFKTFDDAQKAQWCFEPDTEYYKRVVNFYNLAEKLVKTKQKQGIFKYKNINDLR